MDVGSSQQYVVQFTKVDILNIHMICIALLSCHLMLMGTLRYEWGGHAVWLSYELLMEIAVVTLYYFIGINSIQAGTVDDPEASFWHVKCSNFVASPSVHIVS